MPVRPRTAGPEHPGTLAIRGNLAGRRADQVPQAAGSRYGSWLKAGERTATR